MDYTSFILKKIPPCLCRLTEPFWPFSAPICTENLTVSIATWSPVGSGDSVCHPCSWNESETHPDYGWTTPNTLSKLPHDCVCTQLGANAAPTLPLSVDRSKYMPVASTTSCTFNLRSAYVISLIFSIVSVAASSIRPPERSSSLVLVWNSVNQLFKLALSDCFLRKLNY